MTPRSEASSVTGASSSSASSSDGRDSSSEKRCYLQPDKQLLPYLRCDSSDAFAKPSDRSAREVNDSLNLNLGTKIDPNNERLRKIIRWTHQFFLMWWEKYFFAFWDKVVPLAFRQKLTLWLWKLWFPLHKLLLGRSTGIHPDASEEYHALTTVVWWGRLFPVSIERMRFALSQLYVCHPRKNLNAGTDIVPVGPYDMTDFLEKHNIQYDKSLNTSVTGYRVVNSQANPDSRKVMFWLYGGAYLAGDAKGNSTIAETVSQACNVDVFLPDFGLMPEKDCYEILWDVMLSYMHLVMIENVDPVDVTFLGISSGGGLVTRSLQSIAEISIRKEDFECSSIQSLLLQCQKTQPNLMPAGAVLICPFVDYTDSKGAFEEYPQHDLIVTQSVIEVCVPYLEIKLGSMENRRRTSPVYRSFEDLPPLCVVVSEHEVIFDQAILLVNNARAAGVPVTVGMWRYMCHVFCFLSTFIPEGQQSMDFVCNWVTEQYKKKE